MTRDIMESLEKLIAVGQACIRVGRDRNDVLYSTSMHNITVGDLENLEGIVIFLKYEYKDFTRYESAFRDKHNIQA